MKTEGQQPVRWLILGTLLLGGAIWYSWTAQRGAIPPVQDHPHEPQAEDEPDLTRTAIEVDLPAEPEPDAHTPSD